jgi:uncharacterized lipoprotein YmbA
MKIRPLLCALSAAVLAGCGDREAPTEPETYILPVVQQAAVGVSENYRTHMTGAEEVPSNESKAQGQAIFQLSADPCRSASG